MKKKPKINKNKYPYGGPYYSQQEPTLREQTQQGTQMASGIAGSFNPMIGTGIQATNMIAQPIRDYAEETNPTTGKLKRPGFAKTMAVVGAIADPAGAIMARKSGIKNLNDYTKRLETEAQQNITAQQDPNETAYINDIYATQYYSRYGGTKMYPMGGVDYNSPQFEIEKQETIMFPDGSTFKGNGPSHENGGIPMSVNKYPMGGMNNDNASLITSDKLKLTKKVFNENPVLFKKSDIGKTYAKISNRYLTNKEENILNNDKANLEATRTAKFNMDFKNKMYGAIHNAQEVDKQNKVLDFANKMGVDINNLQNPSEEQMEQEQFKKGGKWIQKAVNPAHKGYCTPMTKATCTPRRKALAMTFKKHHGFHKEMGGVHEYAMGGKLPESILRARLESHMSPEEANDYIESYRHGGLNYDGLLPNELAYGGINRLPDYAHSYELPYGGRMDVLKGLYPLDTSRYEDGGEYTPEYKKGGIYIKPSKRGTFTAAATKHGKSVQGFARQVLANKENYSPAMVKKANFARNAAKWKHEMGGIEKYPEGGEYDFMSDVESQQQPMVPYTTPTGSLYTESIPTSYSKRMYDKERQDIINQNEYGISNLQKLPMRTGQESIPSNLSLREMPSTYYGDMYEETPSSTKRNIPYGDIAASAMSTLGPLYDLYMTRKGYDKVNYPMANFKLPSYQEALRQANIEAAASRKGLREVSAGTPGAYKSYMSGIQAQNAATKAQIAQTGENLKSEYLAKQDMFNIPNQIAQTEANLASKARVEDIRRKALSSIGTSAATAYNDYKRGNMDMASARLLNQLFANYKLDMSKPGDWTILYNNLQNKKG